MIDIGIDWEKRYGAGWIRRFSAAPAFEAGSSLLRGAELLWIGRYGRGRVVGASAATLASQMWDLGEHWRRNGLNWTGTVLTEYGLNAQAGYLLGKFRDRRRYRPTNASHKNANAARRLVQAVLEMATDRLDAIRTSGKMLAATNKDAVLWEDRFETLGETPLGIPPDPPLSESGRNALERYATYRTCEGLAYSAASVLGSRAGQPDASGHDPEAAPWYELSARLAQSAADAYRAFARTGGAEEEEALLGVFDEAEPYAEFWERHYSDESAVYSAVTIAALYLSVLLQAECDEQTTSLTRQAFRKAGMQRLLTPHLRLLTDADQ